MLIGTFVSKAENRRNGGREERKEEGRKGGREEGRKEGRRKGGRKERGREGRRREEGRYAISGTTRKTGRALQSLVLCGHYMLVMWPLHDGNVATTCW